MHEDEVIALYERHALAWDGDRGRALFEKPWLDRFLALLPPGASILDLGCGSGEPIAHSFIAQGFTVTGVDASPTMGSGSVSISSLLTRVERDG